MIYLISHKNDTTSLLKIGYTNSIEKRIINYKSHNPTIEVIYIGEGNKENEKFLHIYFSRYRYGETKEWYYYNPIIIEYFSNRTKDTILDEVLHNPIIINERY
jgi:hypothetical protein